MPPSLVLLLVVGVVVIVPLLWVIAMYNRFASIGQHLRESAADVDVELKRRYDLVPNLVATVKGYAAHEREVLERVTALRLQAMRDAEDAHLGRRSSAEREFGGSIQRLVAMSEAYPQLKADANFLELQKELALTEDRIAAARRFYNGNVRELNVLCASFPSNLVAGMFGFRPEGFFELDDAAERAAPAVDIRR
jgi:LemA protein